MTDNRPYACHKCGVKGVKLWRDYGMPFHWDLWCVDCACARTGGEFSTTVIDPASVRDDGTRVSETHIIPKARGMNGGTTVVASFKGEVNPSWLDGPYELRQELTDQLGWYIPAVPVGADEPEPSGGYEAYWGYTTDNDDAIRDRGWWDVQPLRVKVPA